MSKKFQLRRQVYIGRDTYSTPEVIEENDDYRPLMKKRDEMREELQGSGGGNEIIVWVTPRPPERRGEG